MAGETDEQLIALIGMMGAESSAGDGEAVNAFRAASRALARRGISWRDFAIRALARPAPAPAPAPAAPPRPAPTPAPAWDADVPWSRGPSGGTDPREDLRARRTQANEDLWARRGRTPPPAPPQKPRRSGSDVPAALAGTIRIIDDDRRSRILVIEVDGKDAVFGPMLAYAGAARDNLIAATGRHATLRIRPARAEGYMPQVVGCYSL